MDDAAFEELFTAEHPRVRAYLARRAGFDVADDVASQVFAVAWRRSALLPADSDERRGWLLAVARRLLANSQRARLRDERLEVRYHAALAAGVPVVEQDHAHAAVDRMVAVAALRGLQPRDQEILQLVAWDGLGPAALAQVLGCSPRAATVRLHRARQRLEHAIEAAEHAARTGAGPTHVPLRRGSASARHDRPVSHQALRRGEEP